MSEIVNLRAKRKEATRKGARAQGDENALKFGRTKAQKALEAAEIARAKAELDGKKVDGA
ncbi:MAG: DUF4169 family protein [Cypionkella sp.]